MSKTKKYIGGDFSWASVTPYISSGKKNSEAYFPDLIHPKQRSYYQTGVDALCAIILEADKQVTSDKPKNIWFPEHYCYSSIERVKIILQHFLSSAVRITFYKEIELSKDDIRGGDLVIILHFNAIAPATNHVITTLNKKDVIVIEDFVLCPLHINEFKGNYAFNSLRKFIPLDVAVAYSNQPDSLTTFDYQYDYLRKSAAYLKSLVESTQETGFEDDYLQLFKQAELKLNNRKEITIAQPESVILLESIDFTSILEKRKANYLYLKEKIQAFEQVEVVAGEYMFLMLNAPQRDKLRKHFFTNNIFPAIHWLDCSTALSGSILSLPIDQRYDFEDMNRIIDTFHTFLK